MRSTHQPSTENPWDHFLAHNAFACPNCGYNMQGLRGETAARCPECGREIDVETAMYVGAPVRAGVLWRTQISVWAVVAFNLLLWIGVAAMLPALHCSEWKSRPPTEWYGLLLARMTWLALLSLGVGVWWLDLKGVWASNEGTLWVFRMAPRLALAVTVVHIAWVVVRTVGLVS